MSKKEEGRALVSIEKSRTTLKPPKKKDESQQPIAAMETEK